MAFAPEQAALLLERARDLPDACILLLVHLRATPKGPAFVNSNHLRKRKSLTGELVQDGGLDKVLAELVRQKILGFPKGTTYKRGQAARDIEHGFRNAFSEMNASESEMMDLDLRAIQLIRIWLGARAESPQP